MHTNLSKSINYLKKKLKQRQFHQSVTYSVSGSVRQCTLVNTILQIFVNKIKLKNTQLQIMKCGLLVAV